MILRSKEKKEISGEDKPYYLALLGIVILGLILRLIGIKHGFPFIFHPDEPTIIRSSLGVRFNPNPKHFDWPHLYIYLNYFLYMAFAKFRSLIVSVGLRDKSAMLFPLMWNENLIYYYLTRCFSAILGGLTAIPVFLAGKKLFGKKAGIFAALAISIMPYHMWHSHYALGDVPMTFLISWALYFASLMVKEDKLKNYILSGLFIGLASSMKYNGGLTAIMVPVAHFLRIFWNRKDTKDKKKIKIIDIRGVLSLVLSGLSAGIGFLVGTPYALLDFKTFSRTDGPQGAFWQFTNVGSVSFTEHISKFFSETFIRLLSDTGYVAIPVFFIGLVYLVFKIIKKKLTKNDIGLIFLYLVLLPLIWYLSGFKNNRSHYYFIVYPYLAVIFGHFIYLGQDRVSYFFSKKNKKLIKILSWVYIVLIFSPLFTKSVINSYRYYRGETRNMLYTWLLDNYDPTEALIYNDKSLEDVFGLIGIRAYKGLENYSDFDKSLVVVRGKNEEEKDYIQDHVDKFTEVVKFDSKMRLGEDIEVYRYVSPEVLDPGCGCGK